LIPERDSPPAIFVSGAIGEEATVDILFEGGRNRLRPQTHLDRLLPAVRAATLRETRRAPDCGNRPEESLRKSGRTLSDDASRSLNDVISPPMRKAKTLDLQSVRRWRLAVGYKARDLIGPTHPPRFPPPRWTSLKHNPACSERGREPGGRGVSSPRQSGAGSLGASLDVRVGPRFDEGRFVGLSGVLTDVTERRKVQEALQKNEQATAA